MGFPRDYLEFTTWYLQSKGYIVRADNADFTLTVEGVDFVESQRGNIPVLDKLLTTGAGSTDGMGRTKALAFSSIPTIIPKRNGRELE
jgi:hypothetical protein